MDEHNIPKCSHDPDAIPVPNQDESNEPKSDTFQHSLDSSTPPPPKSFSLASTYSCAMSENKNLHNNLPLLIRSAAQLPVTLQPLSSLSCPKSITHNQPQTLFIQALSKLNENSLSFAIINHLRSETPQRGAHISKINNVNMKSGEISPPDSLTSAPPSYSFVLRQMAVRQRPRLMGTFIPSPSFVQHTPPPNYANAFDIYVDNPIALPPPRVYNFGFASMPVVCPECGYAGMTVVTSKITVCTHLCAFILCVFFCWICVPLPYVIRSCKDVYHYCGNCRIFLGMYCPTNPDNSSSCR